MKQGPGRFEYYLIQLEELLGKAALTKNPAIFLYQNDVRTKLFMLEGLSKLYTGLHNKKRFVYALEYFKSLEDLFGAVNYYDGIAKDFLNDNEMPSTLRMFAEDKKEKMLQTVNLMLVKKKWTSPDLYRTKKIRKKIKKADWQDPEIEVESIKKFYKKSIDNVIEFYLETGIEFTDIELQVHDLRRRLRWLSIYPQALRGCVQFVDNDINTPEIAKYLTPEIVNSPFNVMPAVGTNQYFVFVEKNYFLALSYVINSLGKIKDEGLRIMATAEAVENTQFVNEKVSLERAFTLNHVEESGLKDILQNAKEICEPFFYEDNLSKLLNKETIKN